MIKINKEVKVGATILVALVILIFGINFLKGRNFFESGYKLYGKYSSIEGLTIGSPVYFKGYKIGIIDDIELDKGGNDFLVTMFIQKKIEFPKNTIAQIYSLDFMGSKGVRFLYGNSSVMLNDADTIQTGIAGDFASTVSSEVIPLKDKAERLIVKFDSLLTNVNIVMSKENKLNFNKALSDFSIMMQSVKEISVSLNEKMKPGGTLDDSFNGVDSLVNMLNSHSEKLSSVIKNTDIFVNQLADSNLGGVIVSLDSAVSSMKEVLNNIEKGEGSVGALLKNQELYDNINNTVISADELLADLKANPKRYVNFSVFGSKYGKDILEEGVYHVLLRKSKTPLSLKNKYALGSAKYKIKELRWKKYFLYTIGKTVNIDDARNLLDKAKKNGYNKAQIIIFRKQKMKTVH